MQRRREKGEKGNREPSAGFLFVREISLGNGPNKRLREASSWLGRRKRFISRCTLPPPSPNVYILESTVNTRKSA